MFSLMKLPHYADAHLAWMGLAVETDEAFTPIGHGRPSWLGVTLLACGVTHLVKQAWRQHYGRRRLEKSDGAHGCPQGRTYQRAIRKNVHYAWTIRQWKSNRIWDDRLTLTHGNVAMATKQK
jgi:hypothetical protein